MRMSHSLLCLLTLSACGSGAVRSHSVESAAPPAMPARVALAAPVLAHTLDGIPDGDTVHTGLYVGNLVFSGGYVTEESDIGLQNRSRAHERKAEEAFAELVSQQAAVAVEAALDKRKVDWQPWSPEAVPSLEFLRVRGTHEEDGSDNIPLPRWDISMPRVEGSDWPEVDAVMVPYVIHYYGHNAGWFLGQTYGHGAGARYRLVVATWDARTGRPLAQTDITTRVLHERIFQPNSGQLEDFMILVEDHMARHLSKALWTDKSK